MKNCYNCIYARSIKNENDLHSVVCLKKSTIECNIESLAADQDCAKVIDADMIALSSILPSKTYDALAKKLTIGQHIFEALNESDLMFFYSAIGNFISTRPSPGTTAVTAIDLINRGYSISELAECVEKTEFYKG